MYALDVTTGSPFWSHSWAAFPLSPVALSSAGEVLVGSGDGHIYALDAQSGNQLWAAFIDAGGIAACPAIVQSGAIIAVSLNGTVAALYPQGTILWRSSIQFGAAIVQPAVIDSNDVVYLGASDGAVYAFDGALGTLLWRLQLTGGPVTTAPAIGLGGTVVLGTSTGGLVALRGITQGSASASSTTAVSASATSALKATPSVTPSTSRTHNSTSSSPASHRATFSIAEYVGVAVGGVALLCVVLWAVYYCSCRRVKALSQPVVGNELPVKVTSRPASMAEHPPHPVRRSHQPPKELGADVLDQSDWLKLPLIESINSA